MKRFRGLLYAAAMLLALIFSCSSPTESPSDYTISITGTVFRQNFTPLDSVAAILVNPVVTDTTKSAGVFTISFTSSAKSDATTNLKFRRARFYDTTISVTYGPSTKTLNLGSIVMKALSAADDSTVVRVSRRPGVIVYLGASVVDLSIRDAGGIDVATISFEVRDSSGVPVDANNMALVGFRLVTKPDASTYLSKDTARTNSAGTVSVQLTAGTTAGIAQVMAYAVVKQSIPPSNSDTARSPVVSIPIHGGAPDSAHFSLASAKYNLAGGAKYGLQTTIGALVGDKFGNAVQPGTVVSFRSDGGIIQSYGTTTSDGAVTVILTTGEPIPAGGLVTITAEIGGSSLSAIRKAAAAKKMDDDAQIIETTTKKGIPKPLASYVAKSAMSSELANTAGTFRRTLQVLFSGKTQINIADTNFIINAGNTKQVNFTVSDLSGNPLSGGSTVTVTTGGQGAGDVELTGDITKTIPDTKSPAYTAFKVFLRDKRTSGLDQVKPVDLRIDVASDNGNATVSTSGRLLSLVAGSDSGKVGKIDLVNSNPDTIAVTGGGGINSTQIQFKVSDVFDNPSPNIPVSFDIIKSVGGGEYLLPISATTNANGLVTATLKSGIRAGIVQLVARVRKDSISITSPAKTVYISTGQIAQIAFINVSTSDVSVQGVGGTESSTIIFEGRDSLGNSIDFTHQTPIRLIVRGDTSGTHISPNPASTDPVTGRIIANFSPGIRAGVVQVYATALSGTVTSAPVPITIHGGFAVQSHFTILQAPLNCSLIEAKDATINVILGDKYSNPVNPGTAVYFSSTGGVITASASTDLTGSVGAVWKPVNPVPANGRAWLKARTVGQYGEWVGDSVEVVMSGAPIVVLPSIVTNDSLRLLDGAVVDVGFRVMDAMRNPISGGNKVTATIYGPVVSQLDLTGNDWADMPATKDTIAGTNFSIRIADKSPGAGTGGAFWIKIVVDGVSGHVEKIINGILYAPGDIIVPPSARKPAQIGYLGSTASEIYVSGVGATENAVITYEVRDSLGVPITRDQRTYATFSLQFFPNTFVGGGTAPTILPSADSTDDLGKLRVSILSGSAAGTVQVQARIQTSTGIIISEPVKISIHAGFPDQKHFTIAPTQYNFPGLAKAYLGQAVTVQVGDRYSNPVQEGTAVYFNAAHGIITTGMTSDKNGFVNNTLYSANPMPLGADTLKFPLDPAHHGEGFSRLYARTFGQSATQVIDSCDILWTGPPILINTSASTTYTMANGETSGPYTFTVMDYLGHPMSSGTTISVSGDALVMSGDGVNVSMPDLMDAGPGITSFSVMAEDADATNVAVPPKKSQITLRVVHPVYGTYTRVLATGTVQ